MLVAQLRRRSCEDIPVGKRQRGQEEQVRMELGENTLSHKDENDFPMSGKDSDLADGTKKQSKGPSLYVNSFKPMVETVQLD